MPDRLHPTGQPSSEKGQDRMVQAKIPEIHIHKASQRNFIFLSSAHMSYPAGVLHGGRKSRGCRLSQRLLCANNHPMPFSNPTELLLSKTHCGKHPFHRAGSSLHTPKCFQFRSVFLVSYNKVESLCLTPLWLPLSLLPLPPASAASLPFLSRDLPLSLLGDEFPSISLPHSFTSLMKIPSCPADASGSLRAAATCLLQGALVYLVWLTRQLPGGDEFWPLSPKGKVGAVTSIRKPPHPVSHLGSGRNFINLSRAVQRSGASVTHAGSEATFFPSCLIKHLIKHTGA